MRKLLLGLPVVLLLTGCGVIYIVDQQWDPPVLSKEGCPNLDGRYKNLGVTITESRAKPTLHMYFEPYYPPYGETMPMMLTAYPRQSIWKDVEQADAQIQQRGRFLEITTLDAGTDMPRVKYTLDMNHPLVGCHDDALILRRWGKHHGGPWGGCGTAWATDRAFRKLANGSLEVHFHRREWKCSMRGEPKKREKDVEIFPSASKP